MQMNTLGCLMPIEMVIIKVKARMKLTPLSTATAISKSNHSEQSVSVADVHGCSGSSEPIRNDSMTATVVEPIAPIAASTATKILHPNLYMNKSNGRQ